MKEQPSYYAILTANVRYDNNLTDSEKLLYAEITTLTHFTGRCFASNKYFANLYGVSKETISRRVSNLKKQGYLKVMITYKKDSKEIDKRYIQICQGGIDDIVNRGIDANVKDNSTSINNTSIKDPLSLLEVKEIKYYWLEFLKIKKRKRASTAPKILQKQFDKLCSLSAGKKKVALEILEKSVNNGWSDFFKPKEEKKTGGNFGQPDQPKTVTM